MKKMKWMAILMVAVMLCAAGLAEGTVTEEGQVFRFPELDISVAIPARFCCLTQQTEATDDVFRMLELDPEEVIQYVKENGTTLIGYVPGFSELIDLYVYDDADKDCEERPDGSLVVRTDKYAGFLEEDGYFEIDSGLYEGAAYTGAWFHYSENQPDGSKAYVSYYILIRDGTSIHIRLFSAEPLTEAQEADIRGVFDSIGPAREEYSRDRRKCAEDARQ